VLKKIREKDLVPLVKKYFVKQGYIVFTEQYVGFQRADILAIRLDMNEVKKRIEHGITYIPPRTFFRMVRFLDKYGELTVKELAEKLGYSTKYVSSIISVVNPLYLYREQGRVRKIRDYTPYTAEIIGVEVKVKDWKNGLVQAHHYLYAVNKSYLAICSKTFDKIPDSVLKWIKEKGLGLLIINKDNTINEVIKAKKQGPISKIAYYSLSERLWDKVLKMLDHLTR